MLKITVFTPTYNRGYIIENLYQSLRRQSFENFEWLVIDDGSNDSTEELFAKWRKENNTFPIRYYKEKNGGKCRAINWALELAQGELFFTVDSDDYLTDDALEKISKWEAELPKNEKYCGVAGNLGTAPNITPNRLFSTVFFEGTALDRYGQVDGERAMVFYTKIHRKYLYPVFPEEKFMTESVAWNRMARDGYKVRFYNDIIWIYEYLEDGLTKAGNRLFLENPRGYGLWLKEKAVFQGATQKELLKLYYTFTCELVPFYDSKVIAECLNTKVLLISLFRIIHNLWKQIKSDGSETRKE